jgi:hypothetical protein
MHLSSFILIFVCALCTTVLGRTFNITNNCNQKIWLGIQGNPLIQNGGFEVNAHASKKIDVPDKWVCFILFHLEVKLIKYT